MNVPILKILVKKINFLRVIRSYQRMNYLYGYLVGVKKILI